MMMGPEGNAGVTVKRDELLEKLKTNRDAHRAIFLKALEGYRTEAIKELDSMLSDARDGKRIRRAIMLIEPEDHTRDYNRVINMLTMCVSEVVFVTESEFAQYVEDDWNWKRQFIESTRGYTGR